MKRLFISLSLLSLIFLVGMIVLRLQSPTFRVENFKKDIQQIAHTHQIKPELVAAIVYVESKGNPEAISSVGARGLMQLRPLAVQDAADFLDIPPPNEGGLLDPKINLSVGVAYLRILLDRFKGNEDLAIMAYFMGPTAVSKALKEIEDESIWIEKMKKKPQSAGEYLLQVRDFENHFKDRWKSNSS